MPVFIPADISGVCSASRTYFWIRNLRLTQASANYFVPWPRRIYIGRLYDGGGVSAINLKTRLFSICIGRAVRCDVRRTRAILFSVFRAAPTCASTHTHSGFVIRPVRGSDSIKSVDIAVIARQIWFPHVTLLFPSAPVRQSSVARLH